MLPFQPSDNDFGLLTLTPLRKSISTALSHQVWGNLLQQPQEGNGSPSSTPWHLVSCCYLYSFLLARLVNPDPSRPPAFLLALPTPVYCIQVSQAHVGVFPPPTLLLIKRIDSGQMNPTTAQMDHGCQARRQRDQPRGCCWDV